MAELQKPVIMQALMLQPRGGGPPAFRMHIVSSEYGMSRGIKRPYVVSLTAKAWDIIQKNLPMENGETVTDVVYAWDMLRRNRLLVRFEDIIESANETGEGILDIVCRQINFLKLLEGTPCNSLEAYDPARDPARRNPLIP